MVFYYDNWPFGLFWFIVGWALMIISIRWMIIGINNVYRYCLEKRPSESNQTINDSNNKIPTRKETNNFNNEIRNREVNRPLGENPKLFMILTLFLTVLIPVIVSWLIPSIFYFPPRPLSVHWYPEASNTLDTMLIHKEHVNSYLNENILLIEDLKNHMSVYRDNITKEHVKELLNSFAMANNLAKMDMQSLYRNANTLTSALSKTIHRIETKAKNNGKDEEFKEIIKALDNVKSGQENLDKDILILLTNQRNLLPIMRKSLKEIQDLIHNGLFVQVIPIVEQNKNFLIEIGGNNFEVKLKLDNLIRISSNHGLGQAINDEQSILDSDESKAYLKSTLSTLAITSGTAIAGITKSIPLIVAINGATFMTVVSATFPIAAVGVGAYYLYNSINELSIAKDFKNELEKLKIMRENYVKGLEQFKEAIGEQEKSIDEAKNTLGKIDRECKRFSVIQGYVFPKEVLNAFDDEINKILNHYDKMTAFNNLFEKEMQEKNHQQFLN
jgi:hypothetical protein